MKMDFRRPASRDLMTKEYGFTSEPEQNEDYKFHVVCFRDVKRLVSEQHAVSKLLAPDFLESARQFPGADDNFPIFFYLSHGERICAYMRAIPDLLTIDGKDRQWAWTGDNYTYPQFRRRGLSTRLQQTATQYFHNLGIGRGSVNSTEITQRIFKKLRFTQMGYAKRFLMLRTVAPLLEVKISRQTLRNIVAKVLNPIIGFASWCVRSRNKISLGHTACRRITDFSDQQFQELLERIASKQSLHFGIHIDYLRRKFEVAGKNGMMSAWLISEKKTGESLAYMILKERFQNKPLAEKYHGFQLMSLVDYALVSNDTGNSTALVSHCLELFFASNCSVLEIISNKKYLHRAAVCRGLVPVGKGMSFNYSVPASWQWGTEQSQLEKWPLTSFCGDVFKL